MGLVSLVLAGLVAVGLLVLDFVFMRRTDKELADDEERRLLEAKKAASKNRARNDSVTAPTEKPDRKRPPGLLQAGMILSALFGWLNLPATLAPVILVALAMQSYPVGGDGTTALIGIAVAAFSMSASMKAMRVTDYLATAERRFREPLRQSVMYFLGWTALVLCLLVMSAVPMGKVALVVYSYVGVLVAYAIFLVMVQRRSDDWMCEDVAD